ncbi:DUF4233 domain-containing protein [Nocardioides sp. CER19]|uniref:DUF4233 domain-containing protein n=1 Tax=Nocardioides sp. CER19 TaxID=3038538 RepID=UPI002449B58D|nr:DUF4233 domain-containing protein [Nocardioides sp. CER19]MDH2414045.1 DUF4233 domain-containing protein [Nocardioides sp. CER19]
MTSEPFDTPPRPSGAGQNERDKSPRRGMCAAVLALEAITLGLTTPVMISVADVSTGVALATGLGLLLACVLVAGLLRRPWAYALGWAIQAGAIALGFAVGIMFVLGGIFALLWGMADFLGRRIDRERAAAFAAYDSSR